jgi:16S rRNA (guanine966-N2)-methyltransferase
MIVVARNVRSGPLPASRVRTGLIGPVQLARARMAHAQSVRGRIALAAMDHVAASPRAAIRRARVQARVLARVHRVARRGRVAVRIVGGDFRGRALVTPRSNDIRPTTDRTRESLFNILAHAYPEALDASRVIDLFAGTGAVGLEALSRGASQALFVETSVEGRGLLRTNIEALGLQGRARIFRRDAADLGAPGTVQPFNFLFADPPYGRGLGEAALDQCHRHGWLVPGALAILEERADVEPTLPPGYQPLDIRTFGETRMHFYRFSG